jgi:SAM-dependent methyltransferase
MKVNVARGYIDSMQFKEGHLVISGWLFNLSHPFDAFVLKIDNNVLVENKPIIREDVRNVFRSMDHSLMSGFYFCVPLEEDFVEDWVSIEVVGIHAGLQLGNIVAIYRRDFHALLPVPPVELRKRVTNLEDSVAYWTGALKSYGEFFGALNEHCNIENINSLLDWGCGCGRMTSLFLKYTSISNIYGCDIDKDAVCWCRENLRKAKFAVIEPFPRTGYSDNMFDVVIGYSVFTHLTRDVQIQWLQEIDRLIGTGGLFITSVHGEFASNFVSSEIREEMLEGGISDNTLDSNLDGIAPAGYYRGVYQTKAYTQQEWGKYFDILNYIEGGVSNYQDLVIMRKKSIPSGARPTA